jgi:hypothetical protein
MFHFSNLPVSLQVALVRLNAEYHANLKCDRACQQGKAWLDEETDNGSVNVPPLPTGFRFRSIADYVPPNTTPTNEDITHRIGAEFQTARSGGGDWKAVDKPCLGQVHHTVMEE